VSLHARFLPFSQRINLPFSLDSITDHHIQRLLRSKFASHTIIAVAHKLDTILDFDKVIVMHRGRLVEVGEPYQLLEQDGSWFKSLYQDRSRVEENLDEEDVIRTTQ
jgi:ATP-binding cassette, subfamily C (CFTR/MRP), member 1